jgi:hypothetical protein
MTALHSRHSRKRLDSVVPRRATSIGEEAVLSFPMTISAASYASRCFRGACALVSICPAMAGMLHGTCTGYMYRIKSGVEGALCSNEVLTPLPVSALVCA